jgi:hypothetical protein
LQDAINYAWSNNVIVVAAAGNGANNIPMYPAACDHVVAVSATEPDDSLAWFSNYGNHIALAAPGASIWTTQRDPANPYGPWRGTSFASPVVAAVAALVASANPSLTNNEIISVLEQSADDLGAAGIDAMFGYGRVNAAKAVAVASALPGALLVQPPPDLNTNQIVRVDVFAPSIAVTTSPANGARLSSPIVAFAGIASDDSGVNRVELQLNADSFQTVVGTSDWNASIVLAPGANTVRIRSIDSAGNVSPEITFTLTYVLNTPLAVRIDGAGSVTPNLDGKWLEIGRNYSMKAVPDRGQAFAGWSGVSSPSALLNFTMQSNLVLTAHFVPSPFPAVKGTYTGLVAETNRIAPESSGFFRLNVTPGGAFTGKLALGGKRHGFHGRFDLSGNATIHVNRRLLNPITIALHVDLTNVADAVEGSVTDGGWSSVLSGDRNVFNAKLNPASQAGLRAFILERADDTAITAATGASAISSGGAARVKGLLNDGRAFSTASVLARNGDCPFYLSLNRGSEVVIGWLNFPASSSPTASGEVLWVRTGTNAFAATLQATSAP